ncbi:MAG: type III-A CRISPR-associated RAMP protein Csm5 [Bacteroidota bacterium]|nr:type III-A CRISPR-associated RAMP protein Csm5 [Bacteroidota bacterium]
MEVEMGNEMIDISVCVIEVLTPLHVGNGVALQRNYDFYTDGSRTYICTYAEIMGWLRAHRECINEFTDPHGNPQNVLRDIPRKRIYNEVCYSQVIREFIRDGNGRVYIPGSSIKGAMRTAIGVSRMKKAARPSLNDEELPEKFKNLFNNTFGSDPNHNDMRVLLVSDVYFPDHALGLYETRVLNMSDPIGATCTWKQVRNNPMRIYAECLKPGARSMGKIKISTFLYKNERAVSELKFHDKVENMMSICRKLNTHSLKLLQAENDYLERLQNPNLPKYKKTISNLLSLASEFASREACDKAILRIAWGSGWKAMTGDFLTEEELERVRRIMEQRRMRLGRHGFPFPKTRKIVFEHNEPFYPTGWVLLRLLKPEEVEKYAKTSITVKQEPEHEQTVKVPIADIQQAKVQFQKLDEITSNTKDIPAFVRDISRKPILVELYAAGYETVRIPCSGVNPNSRQLGETIIVEITDFDKQKKKVKAVRFVRPLESGA